MENELRVLCRNLYLGADFNQLLPAQTALSLAQIVANFYRFVLDTRYEERAQALAREIVARDPHVVCLQEVFEYQLLGAAASDAPPSDAPPSDAPPVLSQISFLAVLLTQLRAQGAHYVVAGIVPTTAVTLPVQWSGSAASLNVRDHDVVLVRSGVVVLESWALKYRAKITAPLPGPTHPDRVELQVQRGFNWVVIDWQQTQVGIVNTHLESISEEIQRQQAVELLGLLMEETGPVILAGDLNADPAGIVYPLLTSEGGGFRDPFAASSTAPSATTPLNTYGASATLRDEFLDLRSCLDHVLHRGPIEALRTEVFGIDPAERTSPSGLWPSDHAGLLVAYHCESEPARD